MKDEEEFCPDWASPPGDTITDILQDRGLSEIKFAQRMGQTTEQTRTLLQGHAMITLAIARRLTHVLGASVEFWMSRDFQYWGDVARLQKKQELDKRLLKSN